MFNCKSWQPVDTMSDPPKSLPTISFGAPATSGSSAFGASGQPSASENKTSNNLFGSGSNPPATGSTLFGSNTSGGAQPASLFSGAPKSGQGSSLFGGVSGASNPTSTGFSFGPQSIPSTQQSSGFSFGKPPETGNAKATNTSTPFSGFSTPDKAVAPTTPGQNQSTSVFGGMNSSGGSGLFGNAASTPATSKPSGAFSFANPSTTPAGPPPSGGNTGGATSGFSFNKPQQQGTDAFGNFKAASTSAQETPTTTAPTSMFSNLSKPSSGGLFGSSKPADSTAATTTAMPASNLFANANTNSGPGLFNMRAASKPAGALFSNLGNNQETIAPAPTASASGSTSTTAETSQPIQQTQPSGTTQTPSVFANLGTKGADETPTSQGNGTSSSTNPKPSSSFPSSTPAAINQPALASATTTAGTGTSSLFSHLETSNADKSTATPAASSAGGLFANAAKAAENVASSTVQTPSTTATRGFPGTSAPNPASSLYADLNKPASSTSASQPPSAAAADSGKTNTNGTSTTNLGTSTSGPAPTCQSRLKNKSMDEIITRWASDLSKYQKEFQSQAEKVAKWDRMLVENSDKIQKLYGSTLEAERATSEVERQLSAVESQQEELSGWLDRYERDVDALTSRQVGQGEGLQGPDQERERT